ncbi:MAG: TonB-dependent receptor [Bacteroidota bacterium]
MKRPKILSVIILCFIVLQAQTQKTKTDANIIGHVVNHMGEHIPFATVSLVGTTIGTTTDKTGHFQLINLPEGILLVKAQFLGYKSQIQEVTIKAKHTLEIKFVLQEDMLGLEEVVVTGDRSETNRKGSSTIVNTISPKQFNMIQSVTLSEGLNFTPGLRMEANCQNCGFSQLRMNGMEGPYSQILINSRPVFSGLAGVYGLELIPSNMIERVEVIRGGGSALYGSNAIAGTVNLILKDPINNTFEFGANSGLIGVGIDGADKAAWDHNLTFNSSLTTADHKGGMALYGFYRNRQPFDANQDMFSELTRIKNITLGSRLFHRIGTRAKLVADVFNVNESRRGGDKMDYLPHMSGITEALDHNILSGALTYEMFFRDIDLLSVYFSGQGVKRKSYYGANRSLNDYGRTNDLSYTVGAQYNALFAHSKLIFGIENTGSWLNDEKLGYPDLENVTWNPSDSSFIIPYTDNMAIADQSIITTGIFAQYEIKIRNFQASAGARFDHYNIKDKVNKMPDNKGDILSPRLTLKYDVWDYLQLRLSYSQGYRAPQIFDEDLHIESSGSRRVIHENDPHLQQETSHSFMASIDFNKRLKNSDFGFLLEAFYTRLNDAFVNEIGMPDMDGTVVYLRTNAIGGAVVKGINMELNWIPMSELSLKSGFTFQESSYAEPQDFDERRFFRTPHDYGYFAIDWIPYQNFGISSSASYTGKMLIPYFGAGLPDPTAGELRESQAFLDLGLKLRYTIQINGTSFQLFTGVKNIFNSYQSDFDQGIDRDPGYIYGPLQPRTIYFGFRFGNAIL